MKARKINYKAVIKKLNSVQYEINSKDEPIIIIAEKLENGSYQIAKTTKNYKRRDFIIENEKKFNEFLENIKSDKCTVIIDDSIDCLSEEMSKQVAKHCTDEELHFLIEDLENNLENEIYMNRYEKIIIKNVKEIIGDDK